MDIALVLEQLDDAKQLVQSAMESLKLSSAQCSSDARPSMHFDLARTVSACGGRRARRLLPARQNQQPERRPARRTARRARTTACRGDQPARSSCVAGPVARDRRRQRDERELRGEDAAAEAIRHFHLQQHRAEHPEDRPAEVRAAARTAPRSAASARRRARRRTRRP